ncbi:MAG: hypothetical protein COX91_01855, partial [Candidatus Nealsonbacteria bacterium CG_4_10_14_0_2_um_filter_39_15]
MAANWDKQAQLGVTHNISCGGEDPLNHWPRRRRLQMGNKNERSEDRRDRKQARRNKENGLPNPEKTAEVTSSVTKVKDPAPAPVVTTVPTTKAGVSEYN